MRVVLVGDPAQLNSHYRVKQPAQALQQHGHAVLIALLAERELRRDSFNGFDAIYVYRYMGRPTQAIMRHARAAGAAVLWDNDDDVTLTTAHTVESRVQGAMRSQRIASLLHPTLALADVVTTTNPHLADAYRAAGAHEVRTVENFVATEFALARPARHDGRTVIGWIAAREHAHELERIGLRATLRRLIDAHPEVHVESIGENLQLDRDRYTAHGYVRYEQLAPLVARFDIGIAPLVDDEFNRARSNVKLKSMPRSASHGSRLR